MEKNLSISPYEKMGIVSNLTTMLAAGISILDSIDALLQGTKGNQKKLLEIIRNDLTEGKRLYTSFAKFPRVFDKVTVNLIKAAEEAGTLEVTLRDLKKNILREAEFNDQVKGALMYPGVIMVVFFGVFLLILIVVIPRISLVFSKMNLKLPLPTKILIIMSNILLSYPIPVVLVFSLIVFGAITFYKRQKSIVFGLIVSIPLVYALVKKIDLTRFSRSLALLLSSGIPITSSLDLTYGIVLKQDVKNVILQSKEMISSGKKLSDGFRTYPHIIPSIMTRITEAGEKSGTLDKAMQDISEYLEYEVSKELKTVTALLEPIMLVVIGVLIGGIIFSIIVPIYGLLGNIGG